MFSKTTPKYLFQRVPLFWLVCCLYYHVRAYLNTICIKNIYFSLIWYILWSCNTNSTTTIHIWILCKTRYDKYKVCPWFLPFLLPAMHLNQKRKGTSSSRSLKKLLSFAARWNFHLRLWCFQLKPDLSYNWQPAKEHCFSYDW